MAMWKDDKKEADSRIRSDDDVRRILIDLDEAPKVAIPDSSEEPQPFETPDGRAGWVVQIPERRPLATPAWEAGRLFLGGGYGSYSFYSIDAATGRRLWSTKTSDDGPTAAVVEDGLVAFNTESCSIIVCATATGKLVWERWLGDPLMSQPAIDAGRVYIAYPTGQQQPADKTAGHHEGSTTGHALLCALLATGETLWERPISGDVITAPVIEGGRVYLTCFDGRSYCFEAADGSEVWAQDNRGTSAPLVVGDRVVMTEKQDLPTAAGAAPRVPWEMLRSRHRGSGADGGAHEIYVAKMAAYMDRSRSGGSPVMGDLAQGLDADVGFSSAPSSAKLAQAAAHLGVEHVAAAWAFQGSRPAYRKGRIYNAQGRHIHCVEDAEGRGRAVWEAEVKGSRVSADDQMFLPPAIAGDRIYLCSVYGHVLSIDPDAGEVDLLYDLDRPLCAQPCVAKGSLYLASAAGELIRLDTGRDDADGWYMWGGNARHNLAADA